MMVWAASNGKAARQGSVRQEAIILILISGNLPLNVYRASDYPKGKVSFSPNAFD